MLNDHARNDARDHALLPQNPAMQTMHTWDIQLSTTNAASAYLADHVIQGQTIMPAAAQIELVFAAARRALNEPLEFNDISFQRAVFFPNDDPVSLRLTIQTVGDGTAKFDLHACDSPDAGGPWFVCTTGRIREAKTTFRTPEQLEVRRDRLIRQPAGSHYRELGDCAFQFGPAFQGVHEVWRKDGEALSRIRLPLDLEKHKARFELHPALIDASVQALIPLVAINLGSAAKETFVPVSIRSMRLLGGNGSADAWCQLTARRVASVDGAKIFEGDVIAVSDAGDPFIEIEGLELRSISDRVSAEVGFSDSNTELLNDLRQLSPEQRLPKVIQVLSAIVANALPSTTRPLDAERSIKDFGLSSIAAAELQVRIDQEFGVRLAMLQLLAGPSIGSLARLVSDGIRADDTPRDTNHAPPNARASSSLDAFPLTDIQHAYWTGRQNLVQWGNAATHVYLELSGNLDPIGLNRAWRRVIERHPMLRSIILATGEQMVLAEVPAYEITVQDLRALSKSEQASEISNVKRRLSTSVPPTDGWPHFEIILQRLADDRTRLHVNIDMLIVDTASVGILMKDWGLFYQEDEPKPLRLEFREYLAKEMSLRDSPPWRRAAVYWNERSEVLPPPPQLPTTGTLDHAKLENAHLEHLEWRLEPERWENLKSLASDAGLTPASVLTSALAEIISRYSKAPRFTLNVTVRRRYALHAEVNDVVGNFTSTILLGVDWTGPTFTERAKGLTHQLWNDMDHSQVGGVRVLRDLSRKRREQMIMPIICTIALEDVEPLTSWAGHLEHLWAETSQVSIDSRVHEYGGQLLIIWDIMRDAYPADLVDEMFRAYVTLIGKLADGDASAWGDCKESDAWGRVAGRNETHSEEPRQLLHHLGLGHLHARPEHPAIITPTTQMSYAEVFGRARHLGKLLRDAGARPNALVAIVTEPGWERAVAALATLESGAAYLPIDPSLPEERIHYLLADGRVELVLTQAAVEARLAWPGSVRRFCVETMPRTDDARLLEPVATRDDLAYVIYTSGSTGRPKGVMIDHRGPANTVVDINRRFNIGPDDRVLALSNLSFDLSVYDIFGTLAAGGTIVYIAPCETRDPARWLAHIQQHGVTIWNSAPPLMTMVLDQLDAAPSSELSSLRRILLSGDWIPLNAPDRLRRHAPLARVTSLGGATEGSIWSILYPVDRVDPKWRSIPYGKPMLNQRLYVLNSALDPCPTWVTGHLFIAGVGLAKGYWGDEERTRASFVVHPATGERIYRTGDLGRWLPDGNIEFLGREDGQIKIQGYRIEIGEIEAALREHPSVRDSYVLVKRPQDNTKNDANVAPNPGTSAEHQQLVAYVVQKAEYAVTEAALKSFLRAKLPEYMVPARCFVVDGIALNANGKIDRLALANAEEPAPLAASMEILPPTTDTERVVAETWSTVLGIDISRVSRDASFVELGGNSLLLIRMSSILAKRSSVDLKIADVFRAPTVEALARHIEARRAGLDSAVPGSDGLEALRADAMLDKDLVLPTERHEGGHPRRILLTGSTGFLGAYLLRRVLDSTDAEVVCIVRAPDDSSAAERLRATLEFFDLPTAGLAKRVKIFAGDLSSPNLGLGDLHYEWLQASVDVIYHCAADINLLRAYAELRSPNVLSTKALLRLALTRRLKEFNYVSSAALLSASGKPPGEVVSEDAPVFLDAVTGGYLQTKWVSEELVRRAGSLGLPFRIFRTMGIGPDSIHGSCNPKDFFTAFIRTCAEVRCVPDLPWLINQLSVDHISAAMVHVALQSSTLGSVFHIASHTPVTLRQIISEMTDVAVVPFEEWNAMVSAAAAGRPHFLAALAISEHLRSQEPGALRLFASLRIGSANLDAALAGSEVVKAAPPASKKLVRPMMSFLARRGLLQEGASSRPEYPVRSNGKSAAAEVSMAAFDSALERGRCCAAEFEPSLSQSYEACRASLNVVSASYLIDVLEAAGIFPSSSSVSFEAGLRRIGILPKFARLVRRWVMRLAEDGFLAQGRYRSITAADRDSIWQEIEVVAPQCQYPAPALAYLRSAGESLMDVLTGKLHPLELFFPNGEPVVAEAFYAGIPAARCANEVASAFIDAFARTRSATRPGTARLLEFGAGIGGTTRHILPRLDSRRVEYIYTDVAESLLTIGRGEFADYPFVRFGRFDVSKGARTQGFESESFDLLIGANALHAAPALSATLRELERLLAPGGAIVLIEATRDDLWMLTGLGTLGARDDLNDLTDERVACSSPLLDAATWQKELLRHFSVVETVGTNGFEFDVIAAAKSTDEAGRVGREGG